MAHRLEIALKEHLVDPEGVRIVKRAKDYFGIPIRGVRTVRILTIDAEMTEKELARIRDLIFTNPVTQVSSYDPLKIESDWIIWVGLKPGVRDNPGSTAREAIQDVLKRNLKPHEAVYTSKRYCLAGEKLSCEDLEKIAADLLANDLIQQWRIYDRASWDVKEGIGIIIPKVVIDHTPEVSTFPIPDDETLLRLSRERNLALNPQDVPVIRKYFSDPRVISERKKVGLSDPTDVELEYISQARSDHCNHNSFRGKFFYKDLSNGEEQVFDNLFRTFIEIPTKDLERNKPWVKSVLWDNAGVGVFDDEHLYVITGETHNSPSNMEAYGGAITGIVGVYRDPMGTGKGSRLIMGAFGFCVGERNYSGGLKPKLHPRRLLDGVIEGVRDGGNKSGIPTVFGQVTFDHGYMGKCLVFVAAVGIMPSRIGGEPSELKSIEPGDLIIMCGGRVGKDGIHGVTASSEVFSENTPAGHVQIGDPYTQKKMHDFLIEARDAGLISFITDNGGGGLSSSVGESARISNGCHVNLERVPLKYEGLNQWEIWVSESQERMTVAIRPEDLGPFMDLAKKHDVESTVIGRYEDTGKLHITYDGETCAYVDMNLLSSGFPQWEFEAEWIPPELRGLYEPVLKAPSDFDSLLLDLLRRPNIASKEWIFRQYDHEVQGASVIKPLVGKKRDVVSDATVIRPVLDSDRGLAYSQALLPFYSAIDTYWMTACTIDEAVRRVIAVGGDPSHIGGIDNFCWPDIQYDPVSNPDGRFKAAQLVRACRALEKMCRCYEIPLLSGKDSMYVDGHLQGTYQESHKVSALPSMQFSAISVVEDINLCVTMDAKSPGDLVYLLGETHDELGGSEYYAHFGYTGLKVPEVDAKKNLALYKKLASAVRYGMVASAHGVYRGGIGIHLLLVALAGRLGMEIDLNGLPVAEELPDDRLLFSESSGRFIITVDPARAKEFEDLFIKEPVGLIGEVTDSGRVRIRGKNRFNLTDLSINEIEKAFKETFGDLV